MNSQLQKDYQTLRGYWLTGSIARTPEEIYENFPNDIQTTLIRYKHLVLNNIFLKQSDTNDSKAQKTGKNNRKKEIFQTHQIDGVKKDIISYPLEKIYTFLQENIDTFVWNQETQIEVAKHFGIKNLWTFYRIVKHLWLLEELDWKLINLSVEQFCNLKEQIDSLENITAENIVEAAKKAEIKNTNNLSTGIAALWLNGEWWFRKMLSIDIQVMEEIMNYTKKIYTKDYYFFLEDVEKIRNQFPNMFWSTNEWEIKKRIASMLRFYGYNVTIKITRKK